MRRYGHVVSSQKVLALIAGRAGTLAPTLGLLWFTLLGFVVVAVAQDHGTSLRSLPTYHPERNVAGVIRVWGDPHMLEIVNRWQEGFVSYHPDLRFVTTLRGPASALGGLYSGAADIAVLDRDVFPPDTDGFEETFQYKPFAIDAFTGSLDVPDRNSAAAVFLHKDNPLSHLTLAQLDAIFGSDRRRGSRGIRSWGDLGLTGEWSNKLIHVYGPSPVDREVVQFFEDAVMVGSRKWNCSMHTFGDSPLPDGSTLDASQQVVNAVANDKYGIGYSRALYKNSQVKAVALAPAISKDPLGIAHSIENYKLPVVKSNLAKDEGPYFELTKANLIHHTYPLTRTISIFLNRVPQTPIDPRIKEFLLYVLSQQGQQAVTRDSAYLPLGAESIRAERRRLQ